MGFTKLDERILQSSIMAESAITFKVWITLLASCQANGIAYVSAIYLSSICHLPLSRVEIALERLENSDPHSRSLADDGRRIRRIDGGYEIINYLVYRDASLRDAEAERKRLYREKIKGCPDTSGRSPDASASAYASIVFNFKERVWEGITEDIKKHWGEAYPACDIELELKQMIEWILTHPKKGKKKNYGRFINGWLSRNQDSGGTKGIGENPYPRKLSLDNPRTGLNTHPKTPKDLEAQKARQDYIKAHPGDQEGLAQFTQKWFEEHP